MNAAGLAAADELTFGQCAFREAGFANANEYYRMKAHLADSGGGTATAAADRPDDPHWPN